MRSQYPCQWLAVKNAEFTYYKGAYIVLACPKCTRLIHIGNINDPHEDAYKVSCLCGTELRYRGVIERLAT